MHESVVSVNFQWFKLQQYTNKDFRDLTVERIKKYKLLLNINERG